MSFATAERPIQQAVFLSRPSCSSLGVSQLVCLGGFNNTRQEFEVGVSCDPLGIKLPLAWPA